MTRLSFFTSVIAIALGAVSAFQAVRYPCTPIASAKTRQNSDGAFRDGLYLGKLAADRGAESHIAIGRWATAQDRASFTAGYQRGYNEVLASRVAPPNRVRQAE